MFQFAHSSAATTAFTLYVGLLFLALPASAAAFYGDWQNLFAAT